MTNFRSFTVAATKNVFVEIAGPSHVRVRQCTTSLQNGCVFGSRDA